MAIQKINLGTEPLGEGGDTYRSANTKINENFSNQDHAASRLVGTAKGNIPEITTYGVAGTGLAATDLPQITASTNMDNFFNALKSSSFAKVLSTGIEGFPVATWSVGFTLAAGANKAAFLISTGGDTAGYITQASSGAYTSATFYTTKNTTKDRNSKLLLASGDTIPSTSAASRLVGEGAGQIAINEGLFKALHGNLNIPVITPDQGFDVDNLEVGSVTRVSKRGNINLPPATYNAYGSYVIYVTHETSGRKVQIARGYNAEGDWWERMSGSNGSFGGGPWVPIVRSKYAYSSTTATAPNLVIDADGSFRRSSSSIKYKDILSKLELNDELYDKAMQTKPIVYRSKADADPENWHFMSFVAEELGELDPALTQWRTHGANEETGEWGELPEKEAEGINLNAICAVLHATNIYQDKKLKELEQRLAALEQLIEPEPVVEPTVVEPEVVEEEPSEEPSEESK